MQDGPYFRAQAELCLEIARHMSDPVAAKKLRTAAEQHLARAAALEGPTVVPASEPSPD